MSRLSRFVFGFALLFTCTTVASAQDHLSLQIGNGRVTLSAQNVPLRTILTEWGRVGGTSVVGADRVAGGAITMELTDVTERQALEVLLRNVSGYMLGRRPSGTQGTSVYNRILIMPPSAAPRAVALPAAAAQRFPQVTAPSDDDGQDAMVEPADLPVRPGPPGRQPVVSVPVMASPAPLPVPETGVPAASSVPGVVVTPGNPFGVPVGSGSQPGVVTPVPQQQPGQRQDGNGN